MWGNMKAIVYVDKNRVDYIDLPLPQPEEGWVLVKSAYAGICGTDLNIFAGTHPRAKAPLVMGHELSGTVVSENSKYAKGTRVTVNPLLSCSTCRPCQSGQSHVCDNLQLIGIDRDGGMAEYVTVQEDKIFPLPDELTLEVGALAEPVAVAVHAVRKSRFLVGDCAVVYGAGTIGLCVALVLRAYGATNIIVVENNELRLKKAAALGFSTYNSAKEDVVACIQQETNGTGIDYVFDCAGHPAVLLQLTEIVRVQGTVVVVAGYKKPAELNLLQGMFKELTMQFVRVYSSQDIELALQLLQKYKDFQHIITHVLPAEEANKGFELLSTPTDAIKVLYAF